MTKMLPKVNCQKYRRVLGGDRRNGDKSTDNGAVEGGDIAGYQDRSQPERLYARGQYTPYVAGGAIIGYNVSQVCTSDQ
jgi:hypothetical protein